MESAVFLALGLGLSWAGPGLRWGWTDAGLELGLGHGSGSLALGCGPVLVGAAWGTLVPVGCIKHFLDFFWFCFDGLLDFYVLKLEQNMV